MARAVEGFHSFTCTLMRMRLSANGINHAFTAEAGPHFTDPGETEG